MGRQEASCLASGDVTHAAAVRVAEPGRVQHRVLAGAALSWTAEGTKTRSHKSSTQISTVALFVVARRHQRMTG